MTGSHSASCNVLYIQIQCKALNPGHGLYFTSYKIWILFQSLCYNGGTAFELHEKYALPFFLTDMPPKEICGSVMAFQITMTANDFGKIVKPAISLLYKVFYRYPMPPLCIATFGVCFVVPDLLVTKFFGCFFHIPSLNARDKISFF